MDAQAVNTNIVEVCRMHSKALEVLRKVNGKRDYKEIAEIVGIHHTMVSSILSRAYTYQLLEKNNGVYKRAKFFRVTGIEKIVREGGIAPEKKKKVAIRKRNKAVDDYSRIKKDFKKYIKSNFQEIPHPFNSRNKEKINEEKLKEASNILVDYFGRDIGLEAVGGFEKRFYHAFAHYYSIERTRNISLANAFKSLVGCFEPFLKKAAVIRTGDEGKVRLAFGKRELFDGLIPFASKINNNKDKYWFGKPIHEACIRTVYPYRHIEAHESRGHKSYEMDRVIYFMFASFVFVALAAINE